MSILYSSFSIFTLLDTLLLYHHISTAPPVWEFLRLSLLPMTLTFPDTGDPLSGIYLIVSLQSHWDYGFRRKKDSEVE